MRWLKRFHRPGALGDMLYLAADTMLTAVGLTKATGNAPLLQSDGTVGWESVVRSVEKGAANGVATLDSGGKVPQAQLPLVAITNTFVVASQAAMLALTAEEGDVAVRTDLNKSFILTATPASTLGNWQELLTPTDLVLSVFGRTGAVVKQAGDYAVADITGAAPLASPAFTGTPTVPTAAAGTNSAQAASTAYVDLATTLMPVNTQTGSYTLVLSDAGKAVEMNVAGANTLTVPPNSSVAFPIGTVIEICQLGAGQTTLTPGAGVTLRNASSLTTRAQYATVSLRKRGTDEWVVAGDVT